MAARDRETVPNRIFLAYQWLIYRPIFEKVCAEIHKTYPVYFYAIGRKSGQPTEALLEKITSVLLGSTAAVFDASRGNANVSLEYGLALRVPDLHTYLLIDENTLPNQINPGTPIITDLAGATHNRWDLKDVTTLKTHLRAIADDHPYTKRFRRYCRDRELVKGQFRVPLRVIRLFDERKRILRREALDQLQSGPSGMSAVKSERLLSDMHKAGLITITPGREWASRIFVA